MSTFFWERAKRKNCPAQPADVSGLGGAGELARGFDVVDVGQRPVLPAAALDDQFRGMPAEGVGWAAAEATARRSGGGLPAPVVEVAAGGQASGSTPGCVNRTGLPSDRA